MHELSMEDIIKRVKRRAACDHTSESQDLLHMAMHETGSFKDPDLHKYHTGIAVEMWEEEKRMKKEHPMPYCRGGWPTVNLTEITIFRDEQGRTQSYADGSWASIEVCYDTDEGHACALYGIYKDNTISLWAN